MWKNPENGRDPSKSGAEVSFVGDWRKDPAHKATLITGTFVFYDDKQEFIVPNAEMVEIGKWTARGEERFPADFQSSYFALVLLGWGHRARWVTKAETNTRHLVVMPSVDADGDLIFYSPEEAFVIMNAINTILETVNAMRTFLP